MGIQGAHKVKWLLLSQRQDLFAVPHCRHCWWLSTVQRNISNLWCFLWTFLSIYFSLVFLAYNLSHSQQTNVQCSVSVFFSFRFSGWNGDGQAFPLAQSSSNALTSVTALHGVCLLGPRSLLQQVERMQTIPKFSFSHVRELSSPLSQGLLPVVYSQNSLCWCPHNYTVQLRCWSSTFWFSLRLQKWDYKDGGGRVFSRHAFAPTIKTSLMVVSSTAN